MSDERPPDPRSAPAIVQRWFTCLGISAVLVGIPFWLVMAWYGLILWGASKEPDMLAPYSAIEVGMAEEEVRARVGAPRALWTATNAPDPYWDPGYSHPSRDITGKVMIYDLIPCQAPLGWWIVYVYLDQDGTVEEVWIGQD